MEQHAGATREPNVALVLMIIGVAALVLGLAVGGLALASAAGIWLGLWEFGTGFTLLRVANDWGDLVAIACLADVIAILVMARLFKAPNGARAAVFAMIGTVAAGLGYYVPESYRPPEGADIPPIHDISTDTADPPEFVAVLPLRADAANTAEYGRSEGMTPEELARLSSEAYPDLVPFRMAASPSEAFERALDAVGELGWDLVSAEPEEGRIEATDTTFWFRFKDDIVIRIRPDGAGSIVDARSVSRVGRGDVGTNARRLRAFFDLLR